MSALRSVWLVVATLAAVSPVVAQRPDLVDFTLEDQFGRTWTDEDFEGRATVLLVGDRGGATWNEAWGRALNERLGGAHAAAGVALVAVAHVPGVPFFIKGMVRGMLSDDPDRWVLLDWEGLFDAHYPLVPDHANLLVFAPDGTFLRHMVVQEVVPELLDDLVRTLDPPPVGGLRPIPPFPIPPNP